MFYKIPKNTQAEIDEIYEDFVIEIATTVANKVKGKVFMVMQTLRTCSML